MGQTKLSIQNTLLQNTLLYGQIIWFIGMVVFWVFFLWTSPFDPNYTAGENLDHYLSWSETNLLYAPLNEAPYRVLSYPPLFFLLIKIMTFLGLSPLEAGRVLSFLSFLGTSLVVYQWLRLKGCNCKIAIGIVSLFATSFPALYNTGQFLFQWNAIFFSISSLYLLEKSQDKKTSSLFPFCSGLLAGFACFVKQTQVITVLIALFWLFKYQRRQALKFGLALVLTGGLGSILLRVFFGSEIWKQLIIYTVGSFSFQAFFKQGASHVLPWIIFIVTAVMVRFKEPSGKKELRWWYFVGSSLWLLSSARLGASSQYFLEWSVALLLWIGPFFKTGFENVSFKYKKSFAFFLIIQIVIADIAVGAVLGNHLLALQKTKKDLAKLCDLVSSTKSLIVSEDLGILRACGTKPALNPFIMSNLAERKLWNSTPFIQQLKNKIYPVLLLSFNPAEKVAGVHRERWTMEMINAMAENYKVGQEIGKWKVLYPSR